jgi:nucleotide-binding universal stress UspA family protein
MNAVPRYRRVMVPLDGSAGVETVMPFIVDIAGRSTWTLFSFALSRPSSCRPAPRCRASAEVRRQDDGSREYLATIAAGLEARGVRVEVRVRNGASAHEIGAAARESRADLIAMTTHGRSGLRRLVFGSVAAILREADVPVLMMRQTAAAAHARSADESTGRPPADDRGRANAS